jgi:hypothetical protein
VGARGWLSQMGEQMKTREPDPRRRTKKRQHDNIILSNDGDCATASECWAQTSNPLSKIAWLEWRELYTSDRGRVLFKRGTTYVDAVTGTMYRDGRCLSSNTLELGNVKRDQKGGAAILMEMKVEKK